MFAGPPRIPSLLFWAAVGLALTAAACAGPARRPDPALASIWRDYRQLPDERALAVAGQLDVARWVAGASGGNRSRGDAERAALRECAERRRQQRIQEPCLLYASGDEIVWPED